MNTCKAFPATCISYLVIPSAKYSGFVVVVVIVVVAFIVFCCILLSFFAFCCLLLSFAVLCCLLLSLFLWLLWVTFARDVVVFLVLFA